MIKKILNAEKKAEEIIEQASQESEKIKNNSIRKAEQERKRAQDEAYETFKNKLQEIKLKSETETDKIQKETLKNKERDIERLNEFASKNMAKAIEERIKEMFKN